MDGFEAPLNIIFADVPVVPVTQFSPTTMDIPATDTPTIHYKSAIRQSLFEERLPGESPSDPLTLLLDGLHAYFCLRCEAGDLEVLTFCLQHLFLNVTRLHESILIDLARPQFTPESEKGAHPELEQPDLLAVYCTWTRLHLLSGVLVRVESLGHLLVSAVLNMLDSLDIACVPQPELLQTAPPRATYSRPFACPEQWQQGIEEVRQRLLTWEQRWRQSQTFSQQFFHLPTLKPELAHLDIYTEQLLAHIRVIFGELLPALRELPADNEAASALLFDLAQQVDHVLLAASAQQEPLLSLLQIHARHISG